MAKGDEDETNKRVFYKAKYRTLSLFECRGAVVTKREGTGVTGLSAWVDSGASNMVRKGRRKRPP